MKKKLKPKPKTSPRKPKPSFWGSGNQPLMIAHRGGDGAGGDKENTMEAFQASWNMGYKFAETDVILAASGEVVLIHGSNNWIQAGMQRDITRTVLQKMTLDQIRLTLKPGGAQVPTLEEVMLALPEMKFILDLKTDEVVGPLIKLLKRLKAFDRVCVTGFGYGRNRSFIQECGVKGISAGLTVGRGLRFKNMNMLLLKTGRLSDVEAIFMHHSLVSPPMISLVHRRGFKAIVWTANSKIGMKHAVRSGADGVISDRVGLLKEVLEAK